MLLKILAIYLVILVILAIFQRSLLYFPSKDMHTPAHHGLSDFEEIELSAADDTKTKLWQNISGDEDRIILFFHGNATILPHLTYWFKDLSGKGLGVAGLSYRGYGSSGGKPSEQGFYQDARAAIEHIKQNHDINKLVLVGRSLGTGVATKMAEEYDIHSVVLISPYTSIADVAQQTYWYFPTKYLVRDKFDSRSRMQNINEPILLIHGAEDKIIPHQHSMILSKIANSSNKIITYENTGHNNIDEIRLTNDIVDFIYTEENAKKIEDFLGK